MKYKQASLVINPRAGQNLAKIADILAVFAAAGWETNLALKEYGGHTMALATKAAEAGSDLVIAYGGDGTLNQVINGVMHARGQQGAVGLIPGGTANVWASEIGIPDDPIKATLTLIDSDTRQVDLGHVEVEKVTFLDGSQVELPLRGKKSHTNKTKATPNVRQHFLLMAGLGIDGVVMSHVSRPLKYRIGSLATALSAAKELPAQRPFPVEVRTGNENDADILWKGEALQVVIGNTRLYGNFAQMTPDASIDDGILDVCVITAGNPLTTMQQIASLLLRRKPDTLTAEYFRGAHLSLSVPASIALQLDGSAVKLKDYLSKSARKALARVGDPEQVRATYGFHAMPRALHLAIPRTYNDALFERSDSANSQQTEITHIPAEPGASEEIQQKKDEQLQGHHQYPDQLPEQEQQGLEDIKPLLDQGRKVTVVGVTANPAKPETYIVAGHTTKRRTGETQPVAVCIDRHTEVRRQTGEHIPPEKVLDLQEGEIIVVEGKKSKRSALRANQVVIEAH
jgi:YegS/Rv2252/BmrU family lipid kinase